MQGCKSQPGDELRDGDVTLQLPRVVKPIINLCRAHRGGNGWMELPRFHSSRVSQNVTWRAEGRRDGSDPHPRGPHIPSAKWIRQKERAAGKRCSQDPSCSLQPHGPTGTGMDPRRAAQGWTHREQLRDGPTHSSSGMDPQRAAQVPPLLLPAGEGSHLPLKGGGLSLCLSPGSSPAFCSSPRRRNADIADLMVCFTVLMLLSNCCWELLIH